MPRCNPIRRLAALAVVLLAAILLPFLATPAVAFPDVPTGHAYETAIEGLSSLGIVNGYSGGGFGLDDGVKRAQFAKMIVGALGIATYDSAATRFTDLGAPDAHGYPHRYVEAACAIGIIYGTDTSQTLFAPWDPVRRDQAVSMIVRGTESLFPGALKDPLLKDPLPSTVSLFDDTPEPHGESLRIAEASGLLAGLIGLGATWNPAAPATRGEVAQMLWNLLALTDGSSPTPPEDVWVYADGSGDYPTIEAAVARVDPGATIHLGPGIFALADPLYIDSPIDLAGAGSSGPAASIVECPGTVVNVLQTAFSARHVCFISTSTHAASDVLWAWDADIHLDDCYFSGAWFAGDVGGSGIVLTGSTTATVSDCMATLNDWHGIAVDEYADALLENNLCFNNGGNGIGFWGFSTGAALGNTCEGNYFNGIAADADALVSFTSNRCMGNGGAGIGFYGRSIGWTVDNATSENGTGIYLCGQAYVEVSGNTCENNVTSGICFDEASGGTAQNNLCAGNEYGLYLAAGADPTIGTNDLHGNTHDLYRE